MSTWLWTCQPTLKPLPCGPYTPAEWASSTMRHLCRLGMSWSTSNIEGSGQRSPSILYTPSTAIKTVGSTDVVDELAAWSWEGAGSHSFCEFLPDGRDWSRCGSTTSVTSFRSDAGSLCWKGNARARDRRSPSCILACISSSYRMISPCAGRNPKSVALAANPVLKRSASGEQKCAAQARSTCFTVMYTFTTTIGHAYRLDKCR